METTIKPITMKTYEMTWKRFVRLFTEILNSSMKGHVMFDKIKIDNDELELRCEIIYRRKNTEFYWKIEQYYNLGIFYLNIDYFVNGNYQFDKKQSWRYLTRTSRQANTK